MDWCGDRPKSSGPCPQYLKGAAVVLGQLTAPSRPVTSTMRVIRRQQALHLHGEVAAEEAEEASEAAGSDA